MEPGEQPEAGGQWQTHDPGRPRSLGAASRDRPSRSGATSPSSCSTSCSLVVTYLLLFALRFDFNVPARYWNEFQVFLPVACVVSVGAHVGVGLLRAHLAPRQHRRSRCDSSRAGATTGVILAAVLHVGHRARPAHRAGRRAVLATFLFGMVRFQQRLFAFRRSSYREHRRARRGRRRRHQRRRRAARDAAVTHRSAWCRWSRSTTTPRCWNRSIHGVPIAGSASTTSPSIVADHDVHLILLAMPSAPREVVQQRRRHRRGGPHPGAGAARVVVVGARHAPPPRDERPQHRRPPRAASRSTSTSSRCAKLLHGRRVLVTGGGGWIGSEIARQVAEFGPAQLVLLDHDETHLHDTVYDLQGIADPEVVLADIRDRSGDRRGVPPRSGPRSCSTPPRTSTSRCSRTSRARRSAPTCSARST